MIRTYSEMIQFPTIEERFEYLKLGGAVAQETFGVERYLNQEFYRSREWKRTRRDVIARDLGCDLGIEGHEIHDTISVHHMNPINAGHIIHTDLDALLNPEYLISVRHSTHNAIHYGDASQLPTVYVERRPGDTLDW